MKQTKKKPKRIKTTECSHEWQFIAYVGTIITDHNLYQCIKCKTIKVESPLHIKELFRNGTTN